jgi:hypothetical protein
MQLLPFVFLADDRKISEGTLIVRTKRTGNVLEALSCNYCCSGKAVSITYSECLFVVFVTQHAMRMRHIVTCILAGSTLLFHIIS